MDKYLNASSNRSDLYEQIMQSLTIPLFLPLPPCSAGDVKNFESWMFSEEPREKQIPVWKFIDK